MPRHSADQSATEQEDDSLFHLATGGTLDSVWDPTKDTAVPADSTVIPYYLTDVARLRTPLRSQTIFLKDSRDVDVEGRQDIANTIIESTANQILCSTGTFLMPDIARTVHDHPMAPFFEQLNRRVVLTGALVPMRGFLKSDGGFNLGMSTAVLQEKMRGRTHVVMNGSCFQGENVTKDLKHAMFTSSSGKDLLPYSNFSVIPAGGTMDFTLNGLDGLMPSRESHVPSYLRKNVQLNRPFTAATPFLKDSRKISQQDKETLVNMVQKSAADHILITLGIYKMREVQEYIQEKLHDTLGSKRVVLTGSRIPLSVTDMTDAPFNLGYGLGKIGFLQPGIHLALCGDIIDDQTDVIERAYTAEEQDILKEMNVVENA